MESLDELQADNRRKAVRILLLEERVAELQASEAAARNELAAADARIERIRIACVQALAPEIEQFVAVFTNLLRQL